MKKYYSSLDLLRFIGAAAVAFFFHYAIVFGASPSADTVIGDFLNTNGGYVVELFYIVSGFVMYNAYASRIRNQETVFTRFLSDRIIRLYPSAVLTVIAAWIPMWLGYAIWSEPISQDSNVSVLAILLNLFGLNGGTIDEAAQMSVNGPTWYITVLMICYLLFYGIIRLCKSSRGAENVCFVILIVIGIFIQLNPIKIPFLLMSCGRGYLYFFIGVLIAQLQEKANIVGNVLLCLGSIGLILMYIFAENYDLIVNGSLEFGLAVVCPIVIFFINFVPFKYICTNPVVKFLGGISFGIFLWNMPVFLWVKFVSKAMNMEFDYGSWSVYLVIVGINIACGILTYIFIDKMLVGKLKKIRI